MKCYVIKNKEGKYLQFFDTNSDDIGFTDDLTLAGLYDKNEKDIIKKAYSNMEWEYIEITIAEGDLEQELGVYKEALKQVIKNMYYLDREYFIETPPTEEEYCKNNFEYWLKKAKKNKL